MPKKECVKKRLNIILGFVLVVIAILFVLTPVRCDVSVLINQWGLEFSLNADKKSYTVTGLNKTTKVDIIVPSEFGDKPITAIAEEAFKKTKIKSLKIGKNVKTIGNRAFYDCTDLTAIEVEESNEHLKSIDGSVYSKDETLFIAYAPGNPETGCYIKYGVKRIEPYAFYACKNLKGVSIPDSVKEIGESAFENARELHGVEQSSNLQRIEKNAFSGCYCLSSDIEFPSSLRYIGQQAFYGFSNLEKIVLPEGLETIEKYAFEGCYSLKKAIIPSTVSSVGEKIFLRCGNVTVYCRATAKPSGWAGNWRGDVYDVIWGYTGK